MKDSNVVCPKCKADNCPYNDTCIKCNYTLIGPEMRVLDKIVEAWTQFTKLPKGHPDEIHEARNSIHHLQDLIACRMASKLTSGVFKRFNKPSPQVKDDIETPAIQKG